MIIKQFRGGRSATSIARIRKISRQFVYELVDQFKRKGVEAYKLKKVRHAFNREKVSLIIDDSLSKKTGKHIAEVQYHKDHSSNGYIFGHQIVTALVKAKEKVFPLFPKLYSKKTQSKIEFAKELIHFNFTSPAPRPKNPQCKSSEPMLNDGLSKHSIETSNRI